MKYKGYVRVYQVEEAITYAKERDTMWLAGGTDIMVKARSRDWYANTTLIDISGIRKLHQIEQKGEEIYIGALCTINEICSDEICRKYLPVLIDACEAVAGCQIRNRGTIGGNVANACTAGDMIPVLVALDAVVVLAGVYGKREIAIEDLYRPCLACLNHEEMSVRTCYYGNPAGKKTVITDQELICGIRIPFKYGKYPYYYKKVGRRKAMAMSRMTLVILCEKENGLVKDLRITTGAVMKKPELEREICLEIIGKCPDLKMIEMTSSKLYDKIIKQCKITENTAYKAEVCRRLTKQKLREMLL